MKSRRKASLRNRKLADKRKVNVRNRKSANTRRREFPDYNFSKLRFDDRNLIPS